MILPCLLLLSAKLYRHVRLLINFSGKALTDPFVGK